MHVDAQKDIKTSKDVMRRSIVNMGIEDLSSLIALTFITSIYCSLALYIQFQVQFQVMTARHRMYVDLSSLQEYLPVQYARSFEK